MTLVRKAKKPEYTIGKLLINGVKFCDTLEDTDRGLTSEMSLEDILKVKIPTKTCIPTGVYVVNMDTVSGRLGANPFYKSICGGKVPRLSSVKGFDGILIHAGNISADTSGCILVGENKKVGKVLDSKVTFAKLYDVLEKYYKAKEIIYIKVE